MIQKARRVLSEYKIPYVENYDCNSKIFSRIFFHSNINILTYIIPKEFQTPTINLCIVK